MELTAIPVALEELKSLRELYRQEMNCQIIHDSVHPRPGWTMEYMLHADRVPVGYGSVAVAGPWKEIPALYEFYVLPYYRSRMFDLFEILLAVTRVTKIETQSNDAFLTPMLHAFARDVLSGSILFHDRITTNLSPPGAVFRLATSADALEISPSQIRSHGIVEIGGVAAAKGGILFHYNRPYGDIYMEVSEPFRRRGLGSYLVQELKRVGYENGNIPSARCNPKNTASRKTLQKAGFVPCGHILVGSVST